MRNPLIIVLAFLAIVPAVATAEIVDVGVFAFDNLIPGGASAGVNVFDISNFTGATYNLAPDFPVVTELTLQSATLSLYGSAGTQTIDLGDIAPGFYSPAASDEFTTTETFTSATLTATLSASSLQLYDGSTFVPDSTTVTATILPSAGTNLSAGTDFAVLSATQTPLSTPEPGTSLSLVSGILLIGAVARRKLSTRG